MSTRRNVASTTPSIPEKTIAESQGGVPSSSLNSDTRPAVPSDVIIKLLLTTLAMIVVPLGSYFVTLNLVFRGNSTFAGAFAAIMANVVLVGYVVMAMREDQGDQQQARAAGVNSIPPVKGEGKKSQ